MEGQLHNAFLHHAQTTAEMQACDIGVFRCSGLGHNEALE